VSELLQVPTPPELRARAYEVWAWQANRSCARVRRILEREYADFPDLALPTESTMRSWVQREDWRGRANAEFAEGYPQQVRAFRLGVWQLMQLSQERLFDALTGVRELSKEEVAAIKLIWSAWGLGALGANQGGEMSVPVEQDADDLAELTTDERLRRMRGLYVQANTGRG
jgi:hypothetical protein